MCKELAGNTHTAIISFVDLYEKVKQNAPEIRPVSFSDQLHLTESFVKIGKKYDMIIKPCGENRELETVGANCSGCMTVKTFETAIGENLICPPNPKNRKECSCYLTADIGAYNTCGHLCRYCYANVEKVTVMWNMKLHDPASPLLIGHVRPEDKVVNAKQESWIDNQIRMDLTFDKDPIIQFK